MIKKFKALKVILVICIAAVASICFTAATCGPERLPYLYDIAMYEFVDEEHGAYFLKAEHEYGGFGYFTDANGERVEAYFDFGYYESIYVHSVSSTRGDIVDLFAAAAEFDYEMLTLTCTISYVYDGSLEIDFSELIFAAEKVGAAKLRPYDLISVSWCDEDRIFNMYDDYPRAARIFELDCYIFDDESNIVLGQFSFFWTDGGFVILNDEEIVASGTYEFHPLRFEAVLKFESDGIFGGNKPFASYPYLTIKADWHRGYYD